MRLSLERKNGSMKQYYDEMKKLRELVAELREENRKLKQTSKRRRHRAEKSALYKKKLREAIEGSYTIQDVTDIILKIGGISRATLFNRDFHKKYPGAAKCLWGFESYDETLIMVKCLFDDVDVNITPSFQTTNKRKSNEAKLSFPYRLTPLEQCLICKLFFRRGLNEEFIGLIFGKHRTTIWKVLKIWAPRWGKAGEQLSILDISRYYLDKEEPEWSKLVGVTSVVTVDGTDTRVEKNRKDPTVAALE